MLFLLAPISVRTDQFKGRVKEREYSHLIPTPVPKLSGLSQFFGANEFLINVVLLPVAKVLDLLKSRDFVLFLSGHLDLEERDKRREQRA